MNWYNYMRAQAKAARIRGDMQANRMWWQQIHARAGIDKLIGRLW